MAPAGYTATKPAYKVYLYMTFPRPIPDSYWVLPDQFLAGEYPGSYDSAKARRRISAFLQAGFTDFIDLTQPHELVPYESILRELSRAYGVQTAYTRISIPDFGLPSQETMRTIIGTINNTLASGRKIYLHCRGGIGRTGTAVGCYLVDHGMSGEEALHQLAAWWIRVPKRLFHPYSPETESQVEFVRNWRGKE